MKSLVILWCWLARETASWCRTSTTLDCKTVERRSDAEGLSFLTITLPTYGRDFERSLDLGYIDSSLFRSFKRVKGGSIPAFLQGMIGQVFDRQTGRLVATPSIDAIRAIRQLTLVFKKIEIDCTDQRKSLAVQGYLDCEGEVRKQNEELSYDDLTDLSAMSAFLYGNIFAEVERQFNSEDLLPKHGPGKTADRLDGNAKYDLVEWPERLQHSFPWELYANPSEQEHFLNPVFDEDGVLLVSNRVTHLYPEQERPVRVALVPKTLVTPRIIAIEPTSMMYVQQALMRAFVTLLESPTVPNDFFKHRENRVQGMIGFTHQEPNQLMAKEGSSKGELATLDLSEASDRVSNLHVMAMFSRFPQLLVAIQDCRSTKADVPGHGVIHLSKFASMGSALTFPMEAMVFLTVVFLGIQDELNRPLTRRDILSLRDRVRIYGDDIIIPVEYVQPVMNRLNLFGYKVNDRKSFWTGKFRESCGKEYYDGADVSIVRLNHLIPSSRRNAQEVASLVAFRNNLFEAGYRDVPEELDRLVRKILPRFPLIRPTSPVLGRVSDHPSLYDRDRINRETHSPQVRGYVVVAESPTSPVSGKGALLKYFLNNGDEPLQQGHLERYGRPAVVDIKLRWCPPY